MNAKCKLYHGLVYKKKTKIEKAKSYYYNQCKEKLESEGNNLNPILSNYDSFIS